MDVRVGLQRKLSAKELMLLNCGVGKTIQLIANLKPVKLRGVESNGMICAADTPSGIRVVFLDDDIPAGSKIR